MDFCEFSYNRLEFNIHQLPDQASPQPSSSARVHVRFQHRKKNEYIVKDTDGKKHLFAENDEAIFNNSINVDRELLGATSSSAIGGRGREALHGAVIHALEAVGVKEAATLRHVVERVVEEAKKLLHCGGGCEGKLRRGRRRTAAEVRVLFVHLASVACYVCYEEVASNSVVDGHADVAARKKVK